MQDVGFAGNINTWCNNRDAPNTIWKRLDIVLYNSKWFDSFNSTYVTHLPITCSDHSPLIVQFTNREEEFIKYFKFLNIWIEHPQFRETVKNVWDENHQGNPLWVLHQKLERTTSHLSSWSKYTYRDIHSATKIMETNIAMLEQSLQEDNTPANRAKLNKAKAEYVQHLKIQKAILRQKARVRWLEDGDANTAYFHKVIKE